MRPVSVTAVAISMAAVSTAAVAMSVMTGIMTVALFRVLIVMPMPVIKHRSYYYPYSQGHYYVIGVISVICVICVICVIGLFGVIGVRRIGHQSH
ncbi:MAG: hypothetical protein ACERLB_09440 [Gammaproteobacteria bacterium]